MNAAAKWQPDDKRRRILEELERYADDFGNHAQFCREFAPHMSSSKFSKILNAIDPDPEVRSYFDEIKNPDALMAELAEWRSKLPRLILEKETAGTERVLPLSTFRAVLVSVRKCKNKTTPERITKYIAPTGGSKTVLRKYLEKELSSELPFHAVECRESWRPSSRFARERSKKAALLDICSALGLDVEYETRAGGLPAIEDALMEHCTKTKRVLFFDEGEFFSAYVLNLVKMLLNRTRVIVIIACTPRAHVKWNMYHADEADQIARRTHAVVRVSTIDEEDAALFFPAGKFADAEKAIGTIAKEASFFGHYSFIARIVEALEKTEVADVKDVESAMKKARRQMGRENWDGRFHIRAEEKEAA
jgi:hypothetical protein